MGLSLFLAKLLGFYFLIVAALWLWRRKEVESLIKGFIASDTLVGFSGFLNLLAGIAIVVAHSIWTGWPIVITLIGYLAILQGIIRIGFPAIVKKKGECMMQHHYVPLTILIVLGIFFLICGFSA